MQGPLSAHGAVRSEHGPISTLIKTAAELAFAVPDEVSRFLAGHRGEIINVLGTMEAKSRAVVAFHVFPPGGAGGSNAEIC